jgi:hypothetical protein
MDLGQSGQIVHETSSQKKKKNREKWTGSVAQTVEHQLCKFKALSSNPGPTNQPTNKKQLL